jgi:hypothetical protein
MVRHLGGDPHDDNDACGEIGNGQFRIDLATGDERSAIYMVERSV